MFPCIGATKCLLKSELLKYHNIFSQLNNNADSLYSLYFYGLK